jgi:hypothetical protein
VSVTSCGLAQNFIPPLLSRPRAFQSAISFMRFMHRNIHTHSLSEIDSPFFHASQNTRISRERLIGEVGESVSSSELICIIFIVIFIFAS